MTAPQDDGYTLGIAVEGIRGYYVTDYPAVDTLGKAEQWAKHCNDRLGHSEDDVFEIVVSTMGGNGRQR